MSVLYLVLVDMGEGAKSSRLSWQRTEPTCVLRPDRQSALIGWQDLQFDHVGGVGQQLCDLHQRAVLCAGLVYGQKDVSNVQRAAPVGEGGAGTLMPFL